MKTGDILANNLGNKFTIFDYKNYKEVGVRFHNTGYEYYTSGRNIAKGTVKDKYEPSIFGVGYIGEGATAEMDGVWMKTYTQWIGMLTRCYSADFAEKNKRYIDHSVNKEWHNYQNFYNWARYQKGFEIQHWELDKDLIKVGNKEYSEDTCCFVPGVINAFLTNIRKEKSSGLPLGVNITRQGRYAARVSDGSGKSIHIGVFSTPEDAFAAYVNTKDKLARTLAQNWEKFISESAFNALMNYSVTERLNVAHA